MQRAPSARVVPVQPRTHPSIAGRSTDRCPVADGGTEQRHQPDPRGFAVVRARRRRTQPAASRPCVRCRAAPPSQPAAETYPRAAARPEPERLQPTNGVVSEPGCTPHAARARTSRPGGLPPPKDGKRCSERGERQRPRLPQPGRTSDQRPARRRTPPPGRPLWRCVDASGLHGWTQKASRFRGASQSVADSRYSEDPRNMGGGGWDHATPRRGGRWGPRAPPTRPACSPLVACSPRPVAP